MAKADAVFTIGADASAFSREAKKVEGQTHDFLTRLGGKFFGLQAIAVGVQKAFAGLSPHSAPSVSWRTRRRSSR